MVYDREGYERRKHKLIAKPKGNEFFAYSAIRDKRGFDDFKIRRLLRDYTMSEILAGSIANGRFHPKEMYALHEEFINAPYETHNRNNGHVPENKRSHQSNNDGCHCDVSE